MNRFVEMRDEIMRTLTLIINYYLHNKKKHTKRNANEHKEKRYNECEHAIT